MWCPPYTQQTVSSYIRGSTTEAIKMQGCRSCTLRPLVIESDLLSTTVVLNGISAGSRTKNGFRYACYIVGLSDIDQ